MIGIDLGTTNSAVSVIEAGFPIVLADKENRRLLPSLVSKTNDNLYVGHEAIPHTPSQSVKSLIGREEVPPSYNGGPTKIMSGRIQVMAGDTWMSPVQVSAEILKTLKATAEFRLGKEQREAVITVPAYFNDRQRAETKEAAELAGLKVRRLIAEPTAAALAYGLERASENTKIAVYDLGGGTFDLSIIEMRKGNFEVLATAGDTDLGGDDFDTVLAELLDCSISEATEQKRAFDTASSVSGVTAEAYEKACWKLLERSRKCCERALIDSGIKKDGLDRIILVGGSTKMPMVRKHVAEVFQQEPDLCLHPDEAVALGAGIQAGLLDGTVQTLSLIDVTPLSLGIETLGGLMNVIIPRNSTIPCKKGELFTNAVDGQTSMKVKVLQGEREFTKDNWELGEFEVAFTPAPKGQARVGIQFSLDANGILSVLARDTSTQEDTHITIERSTVDITEVAVEKMIDESVDHALDDMDGRVFTEAKMKADELLPSLDEALTLVGEQLDEETKAAILASKSDVIAALESQNGAELKKAVEKLDDATEELASLVMQSILG